MKRPLIMDALMKTKRREFILIRVIWLLCITIGIFFWYLIALLVVTNW